MVFTLFAIEEEAAVTSDCVASEPLLSEAPVRVRVAEPHTSLARLPNEESVRVPLFHTAAGSDATEETRLVRYEPMDEDAVVTTLVVFVLILAASEVDAIKSALSVWVFTPEAMPAVAESV